MDVSILSVSNANIGYLRDRTPTGELKPNILPVEARQTIAAKVQLTSTTTKKVIWGPEVITASIDFDFVDQDAINDLSFIDSSGNRQSVLSFSLGQLESFPSAEKAARKSLYKAISQKIIDAIIAKW